MTKYWQKTSNLTKYISKFSRDVIFSEQKTLRECQHIAQGLGWGNWGTYIIYDSLHLTPCPELQARSFHSTHKQKTTTLTQIVHFPFSRVPEASGREPEADRKLTGRLTSSCLFYCSSGSSRKVPGRLTRSLLGAVVLCGSRKVPGRFPEDRPEGKNSFDVSSKPM